LQALFRNPLADPFVLGVSGGGAFGASIAITFGWGAQIAGLPIVFLTAFAGAGAAVLIAYRITSRSGPFALPSALLLAGVVINLIANAGVVTLQYFADYTRVLQILRWLIGSLDVVGFDLIFRMLPFLIVSWIVLLAFSKDLQLFAVDEEIAVSLGVNVRRLQWCVYVFSCLGIAVTGYLFFLHHYYHRWTPIPKGIPRIIATEAAIPRTYEQLYYGLLDNKTLGEQAAQEGALHFLFTNLIHNPERLWSIYRANLNLLLHLVTPSFEVSRKILSPVLALLILTGFLLKGRWRRQDFKKELYLLTFFAPLPGQLLYMIDERVCIYLLPALILWGGRGIGVLAGRFGEMLASRLPPQKAKSWARVFLFSFVGFIVSVFIIKSPLIALAKSPMASLIVPPSPEERFSRWQRSGFEEPLELKEVGKWLRKHGKPNPRIMERKAIVAFYAGGTNVALPYAEYPEILKYAKRVRADYLIADERFVGNLRPSLKFLLDEKNSPAELKLVAEYSFPKVLVYEFRNP